MTIDQIASELKQHNFVFNNFSPDYYFFAYGKAFRLHPTQGDSDNGDYYTFEWRLNGNDRPTFRNVNEKDIIPLLYKLGII